VSAVAGTTVYIQALALGIAPEWRRSCSPTERRRDIDAFGAAEDAASGDGVRSTLYTSIGLEPATDIVLWRTANSVDALEVAAARLLRSGLGAWCTVQHSFIGRIAASQYVARPSEQESGLMGGERNRYLIVYPFTKSTDWYLQSREVRQAVMNQHMKLGHEFPMVRQALAYSFGLDDQDFVVAYETDDLPAFGELVRQLRGTESRRSTVNDTPILLGIHRAPQELIGLLVE
jgi:chlorite dismutase